MKSWPLVQWTPILARAIALRIRPFARIWLHGNRWQSTPPNDDVRTAVTSFRDFWRD
jgi:hypothetical protein